MKVLYGNIFREVRRADSLIVKSVIAVLLSLWVFSFSDCVEIEIRDEPWVDINHVIEATPTKSYMEEKRNVKTADIKSCKKSCDEWTANDIFILKYDSETQKCTCFYYPWIDIYWYEDSPKTKTTETYSVKRSLSRNVRPKPEPPVPKKAPTFNPIEIISSSNSGVYYNWVSDRLYDGILSTHKNDDSCFHSNFGKQWVALHVNRPTLITKIEILNRGDCCEDRINGARVKVCNGVNMVECTLFGVVENAPRGGWIELLTPAKTPNVYFGDTIRIEISDEAINICEVRIYGN